MQDLPLVSVAFPLFRSARFASNIAANIDRLTYPNLEILISDRHGLDDAVGWLAQRYAADPRVRIIRQCDGADWVTHYNDLAGTARGEFMCWMPHDDVYEANYIEGLAGALRRVPDASIAFGRMTTEGRGGHVVTPAFTPPPIREDEPWALAPVFRLLLFWDLVFPMRGLFRREIMVRRKLMLARTHQTIFADHCWVFSMALAGRLVYVPNVSCCKRYYASSASAGWRFGIREALSQWRVMSVALWRSAHPRHQVIGGLAALSYLAAGRVIWRGLRGLVGRSASRAPAAVRRSVLAAAGRWLSPAPPKPTEHD
jgi:GT2 family glycosyltransferase